MKQIDPIADPAWNAFVASAPEASIFHHPSWIRMLQAQYGYEISAWCTMDDSGRVLAGLPVATVRSRLTGDRLVALPFSDSCSPLTGDGGPPDHEDLVGAIASAQRASGLGLEIRGAAPIPGATIARSFYSHTLSLDRGLASVEAGFRPQLRRGVRKARKLELRVERTRDAGALDDFYSLHLQTRRHHGIPTQPKRFIRGFSALFEEDMGFVALVRAGKQPIAAAVFLVFGDVLTYKYGASDRQHLDKRPNNLLFAEMIRWACESGFRRLDFGRTELENDGLRRFKRAWGADEADLVHTYVGRPPPTAETHKVAAWLIRHSPVTVGRAMGQLVYRHYG